ncbi:hypothetical protein B0H21DRAFT_747582 [Amylocystis lapponica]|nr:hypothetical protein B0H21DRAFT_747582 [Amylocystis lapponica]
MISRMSEDRVPHLYRGQPAKLFYPEDSAELTELRARQRTFDGTYMRGALGSLGYAVTVLRLFDHRFHRIGIIYTVLAGALYALAFFRQRHSRHNFADCYRSSGNARENVIQTVGQQGKRCFGRPFVTAGWIVMAVTVVVAAAELGLLILILKV